jgi:hypothetical protein
LELPSPTENSGSGELVADALARPGIAKIISSNEQFGVAKFIESFQHPNGLSNAKNRQPPCHIPSQPSPESSL